MMPRDQPVLRIEASGEPVVVIGPVDVVLDVLFPAPDDLHRPVDLLGDRYGLGDAVNVQPPAEAAADQMIVHLDLVGREPGHLRGRGLRPAHHLDSHPDIAAVLGHMHRAVHRLHRGMREERHLVDGLDLLGGGRHGLGDVAIAAGDDAVASARRSSICSHDARRRDIRVRALVPFDVERGKALHRRPHMIADHRDGIVEPHHLAHALDRHGLAVVDAS